MEQDLPAQSSELDALQPCPSLSTGKAASTTTWAGLPGDPPSAERQTGGPARWIDPEQLNLVTRMRSMKSYASCRSGHVRSLMGSAGALPGD